MQDINNYIRKTIHISRAYNFVVVMYLQLVQHITLFSTRNKFFTLMLTHSEMCEGFNMGVFVVP
jgi:hypothetical protein